MNKESHVNGVWMGILSHYFPPTSNYIVAPEYYVQTGRRGDAMVFGLDTATGRIKLTLAFEGKADAAMEAGRDWDSRVAQLKGYTGDVLKSVPFGQQR